MEESIKDRAHKMMLQIPTLTLEEQKEYSEGFKDAISDNGSRYFGDYDPFEDEEDDGFEDDEYYEQWDR